MAQITVVELKCWIVKGSLPMRREAKTGRYCLSIEESGWSAGFQFFLAISSASMGCTVATRRSPGLR
ncbi:hypothetical protein FVF58_05275 [Paraburkholderia panacisoli]|uniref:Uncharacterized protein n=1 Tax=Paraburkholderia panacisoli TaxID=2603818 RepID=A0A5B0HGB7_9BURK|nr:hypothetical protein [Paraburkholderia panacisoli]KAA1014285.1 hypothetical protein FVF58_05275 [Paraburkholderia panacisoli]